MPSAAIEICDLWMAEADDRDLFFIDLSKIILASPGQRSWTGRMPIPLKPAIHDL